MKLSELMHHLTPGVLESVKQSFRQGYDWRGGWVREQRRSELLCSKRPGALNSVMQGTEGTGPDQPKSGKPLGWLRSSYTN